MMPLSGYFKFDPCQIGFGLKAGFRDEIGASKGKP
jgi:hypothetical protein